MTGKLAKLTGFSPFAFALVLSCVALTLFATPAFASSEYAQPASLQGAKALDTAESDSTYVYNDGASYYHAIGVTQEYDVGGLADRWHYNSQVAITAVSGTGAVSYQPVAGDPESYLVTATKAGVVTVTCTETWTEDRSYWDSELYEYVETSTEKSENHSFTINVITLKNTSGKLTKCITASQYNALFTFKIEGLPSGAEVTKVSDSNKKGYSWVQSVGNGQIVLYVSGKGTHNVTLEAYGKRISVSAVLRIISLKKTDDVKNTGSVVTFPGHKSKVGVSLTGVKNPKASWTSTNKKIAKVSKKGVVTAKRKGRCYLKGKVGNATVKVLVEVTSKGAYKAVKNAFADKNTKISYSQPDRMGKNKRDCSSFVSRCYWDASLGRRIFLIGGYGAASWAYNAAAQAQWLQNQGKRVAWKSCSVKKLRPGDTVYYETDYAGKDASQWRYIDHAAIYVGNGLILNTGGYGGKGNVGFRNYWPKDTSIKFIGRPCP